MCNKMEIYTTNTQEDGEFGTAKRIVIKSFRQVSIFGDNYTKIVHRHSPVSFSIEKIGDDVDPDENVQVVDGPRAEEIITQMIELEKSKGSTFVWNGAHFENQADVKILKDTPHKGYWDPLVRDPVEPEADRRKRHRRKEDKKLQPWEEYDEKKRQEDEARNRLHEGTVVYVVKQEGDSLDNAYYQAYRPDGTIDENYELPVGTGFWIVPSDDPEYKGYVFDVCGRKWPLKILPDERKNKDE